MATVSPTMRSMKHLRNQGYLVAITERWNAHAKVRQDLYGFIDLIALRHGETVGVQTTTLSNLSARRKKIAANANLGRVSDAGWKVVIHGWHKNSKGLWILREEIVE